MNATATAEVATTLCYCGCETPVMGKKSRFAPGHDARYVGVAARTLLADNGLANIDNAVIKARAGEISRDLSPALAAKFEKMAANLLAKETAKVGRKEARLASRKAQAKDGLKGAAVTVKVGRWVKPGVIAAVAGGKPAVITYLDSKGKTVKVDVTAKTEWALA